VPAGLKMSEEYGDAVNILFVEVQGADAAKVERFALEKKWLGTNAMWTTERPFNVGLSGIPNFALLDSNGEVILKGYSSREHSKIEELVAAEVKAASKGPKDLPKSLRKAWKAFHKGDLAKGIAEAEKVAAKGKDDAQAAEDLAADLRKRAGGMVDRAKWMVDSGYLVEADEMIDDLAKGVKGEDELSERVAELRGTLDADDMKTEMEAAKLFSKVEAALYEDGIDARGIDKKLEKVVRKYEGTKAAKRAQHLLELIG
jgi:hypothetical protein